MYANLFIDLHLEGLSSITTCCYWLSWHLHVLRQLYASSCSLGRLCFKQRKQQTKKAAKLVIIYQYIVYMATYLRSHLADLPTMAYRCHGEGKGKGDLGRDGNRTSIINDLRSKQNMGWRLDIGPGCILYSERRIGLLCGSSLHCI